MCARTSGAYGFFAARVALLKAEMAAIVHGVASDPFGRNPSALVDGPVKVVWTREEDSFAYTLCAMTYESGERALFDVEDRLYAIETPQGNRLRLLEFG